MTSHILPAWQTTIFPYGEQCIPRSALQQFREYPARSTGGRSPSSSRRTSSKNPRQSTKRRQL